MPPGCKQFHVASGHCTQSDQCVLPRSGCVFGWRWADGWCGQRVLMQVQLCRGRALSMRCDVISYPSCMQCAPGPQSVAPVARAVRACTAVTTLISRSCTNGLPGAGAMLLVTVLLCVVDLNTAEAVDSSRLCTSCVLGL